MLTDGENLPPEPAASSGFTVWSAILALVCAVGLVRAYLPPHQQTGAQVRRTAVVEGLAIVVVLLALRVLATIRAIQTSGGDHALAIVIAVVMFAVAAVAASVTVAIAVRDIPDLDGPPETETNQPDGGPHNDGDASADRQQ